MKNLPRKMLDFIFDLRGRRVESIQFKDRHGLYLVFQEKSDYFIGGERELDLISCWWRIEKDQKIEIGTFSAREFEKAQAFFDTFAGKRLDDIEISLPFFDLTLTFDDRYILRTFAIMEDSDLSKDLDSWEYLIEGKSKILAGPGPYLKFEDEERILFSQ